MFSTESKLYQWLSRFSALVLLNILWLLCCMPLITIGVSTTAMHSVTLKMVRNEEGYIVRDFFHSFKQNFKQATAIWLIVLVYTGVLLAEVVFCIHGPQQARWLLALTGVFIICGLMTVTYVFPVLAFFDDSLLRTVKNAFLMAAADLPRTVFMIAVNLLPIFILWFFSGFIVIASFAVVVIGFSFCAWLNARHLRNIFDKYIPESKESCVKTA